MGQKHLCHKQRPTGVQKDDQQSSDEVVEQMGKQKLSGQNSPRNQQHRTKTSPPQACPPK